MTRELEGWTGGELPKMLVVDAFRENYLYGMLTTLYNNSPIELVMDLYPGKYHEWEFVRIKGGFWKEEGHIINAIKWLFTEKYSFNRKFILENYSLRFLIEEGVKWCSV